MLHAMSDPELRILGIKLVAGEFYDNIDFYLNLIKDLDIESSILLKSDFIEEKDVKRITFAHLT